MPRPSLPGWNAPGGKPYAKHCRVWNYSGALIADKSTVMLDPANTLTYLRLCMKTIDGVGYSLVKGVIEGGDIAAASGSSGWMCYRGVADALVSNDNGNVAVGDSLVTSDYSTGGYAEKASDAPAPGTVVGIALEAQASDGSKKIYVDPR